MRRTLLLAATALIATLLTVPGVQAQAPAAWTLGDVDSASHWGPKAAQQLSEAVDKATGGKLKITVYPTESLFKGKDSLDAVSKNLAQIYRVAGFHVAGEAQLLELMDLPLFVPWDYEFRVKVWDAVTPLYRDYLKKKYGIYLAGILQAEPRMIYTKTAIKSLADLKGKKIRSAGPTETEFTRALGHDAGFGRAVRDLHRPAAGPARRQLGGRRSALLQQGLRGHQVHLRCRQRRRRLLRDGQREGARRTAGRLAEGADGRAARLRRRAAQGHGGRRHQWPAMADQGRHDRGSGVGRGSRDHAEGRGRDRRQVAEAPRCRRAARSTRRSRPWSTSTTRRRSSHRPCRLALSAQPTGR